jgi:hypothetical protein
MARISGVCGYLIGYSVACGFVDGEQDLARCQTQRRQRNRLPNPWPVVAQRLQKGILPPARTAHIRKSQILI